MNADVRKSAFAMPFDSPSYPVGPYRFIDREYMAITYRTDREVLERIVPEPLEIVEPIVRYQFIPMPHSTGFGSYTGSAQTIPVRFNNEVGAYTHLMYLDAHPPIAGGRELWGFPQRLASPSLKVERDTLVGTLDFGPARIAIGTMGYKHRAMPTEQAMAFLQEPGFLLKIIPHVDGSPRICELVRYRLRDLVFKGAWAGPAALALHPHALAPVSELPVREFRHPYYCRSHLGAWRDRAQLSRLNVPLIQ
jgi:acetoacetate decarboxylase